MEADRLERLERWSHSNHRHQIERQRCAKLHHMKTQLILKEFMAANEELGRLLASSQQTKICSQVPIIQSATSELQLEAQPNEEKESEDMKTIPDSSMGASNAVEEHVADTNQSYHNVFSCDQKIVKDKFIVERSYADATIKAFQIQTVHRQEAENDRHPCTWFVLMLQVVLFDVELTRKVKDQNHVFKPGRVEPFLHHCHS